MAIPSDKKKSYEEVFNIEIEGWCYGVSNYPGEIYPGLVHLIIKELAPTLKAVIDKGVIIDIVDISKRFSKAAKFLVHEKEITFSLLAQLPNPNLLSEEAQFTMAQSLDKVEQTYSGVLARLERRWVLERQAA